MHNNKNNQQKIKNIYIFVGPPGSGKGTISALCVERFGWVQLSTGDLFRWHIAHQTEIGRRIDKLTKSGKLVPDEIVVAMVKKWLEQQLKDDKVVILDGFPRTVAQAQALQEFTNSYSETVAVHVIELEAPDDTIVERLTTRLTCSNAKCQAIYSTLNGIAPGDRCAVCGAQVVRRVDDQEESIRRRLFEYHTHAKELVDYLKGQNCLYIQVSAVQPIEDVFKDIKERISAKQ